MLQHMGDAAGAPGQVQVEEGAAPPPTMSTIPKATPEHRGHAQARTARRSPDAHRAAARSSSRPNSNRSRASGGLRSIRNISESAPGPPVARPIPRSIRRGCSRASVPNCSAMTSGEWLGSITPPEPTRFDLVTLATCASTTAGAALVRLVAHYDARQTRSADNPATRPAAPVRRIGAGNCIAVSPSRIGEKSRRDIGSGVPIADWSQRPSSA